jgi:two-component system sensor histidine kinase KdpD
LEKRGKLRVFLGAAPGVGKTYAMLEEGHRLRSEGCDVAIGFVEPHGRRDTAALIGDLEVIPRVRLDYRGTSFEEMDLEAVLERHPEVALIDELAHTNVPGSTYDKRWQDVEEILDAGIDVLTTLNIQHLESLNDVVYEITGVTQRETIPDEMVRRANQIELVDLTQEGITERMAAGKIYPPERIDAALANYFRPGNLGALRELALSWTADRVDEALATYREAHGIAELWETKERVVVAIAGAEGGDAVIRRAARMVMRARADLIGVFVRPTHGLADEEYPALAEQRALLEQFGGRYYEIVGDDVGGSLVAFAKGENATRLVVGASRRSRTEEWLRGSPIGKVIRESGPLDVHIISYEGARRPRNRRRIGAAASIGWRRQLVAWVLAVGGLPLLTWLLLAVGGDLALHNILLVYLLAALLVAAIGGIWPAVAAAGAGFMLANWFFTEPVRTWTIADPDHFFSLFAFVVVAVTVGLLVGMSTRRSAEARKARAQAEALAASASQTHPVFGTEAESLVHRVRETFALTSAAVLRRTESGWETLALSGAEDLSTPDQATETIEMTDDTVLVIRDGRLTGDDRRVLRAFAAQITQAVEREGLEEEARSAEAMVQTDRLRTALLGAVSHDLRTPLATIKASVTSLLETGVAWSPEQTHDFLVTIRDEIERLNRLVGRLLDASRVQAGAVHVFFREVSLEEVVTAALAGLGPLTEEVDLDVPEDLPHVQSDPALLERVVANLVENAIRWSPPGTPVTVSAGQVGGRIDLRITDRGPGIPRDRREEVFQPFQRLSDSQPGEGVGLGLAVSRGFLDAMGNELLIEDTPGGGTTMVIGFKPARAAQQAMTPGLSESRR